MLHKTAYALVLAILCASSAAAVAAATLSIQEQMKTVVDPASKVLFAVASDADPSNGPPPPVISDARWTAAAEAAAKLKSVADSFLEPGRTKDAGEWTTQSKQFSDLADSALKAAKAKDGAKLSQAANDLGDNCAACHAKYRPKA